MGLTGRIPAGGLRRESASPALQEGEHHLCISFTAELVDFFPTTDDPAGLARRLARLVRILFDNPSAIACAAGHHPHGPATHR